MKLINLTPHVINIENANGELIAVQPEEKPARIASTQETVVQDDLKFNRTIFGDVENLPDSVDGVIYIVSMVVAQAVKRGDVVSPDSGSTAERKDGQIVFVRGLCQWD